jgi:FKBP-type peptidyl-prolyl cis-trans isomerase 2
LSIKDGNKLIPYQSSYDSKIPMSIIVGKTSLIKGFEDALIGMKVGEMKTIILPPEQAYGAKENGQVMVFDSNRFEDFNKVQVGAIFDMGGGSVAEIIEKRDTNARALVYPKLAGQTLVFVIELVSIK